jgi:hypothetical protein
MPTAIDDTRLAGSRSADAIHSSVGFAVRPMGLPGGGLARTAEPALVREA